MNDELAALENEIEIMCYWKEVEEKNHVQFYFETSCGHKHSFDNGTGNPTDANFAFCPYCGNIIKEK